MGEQTRALRASCFRARAQRQGKRSTVETVSVSRRLRNALLGFLSSLHLAEFTRNIFFGGRFFEHHRSGEHVGAPWRPMSALCPWRAF